MGGAFAAVKVARLDIVGVLTLGVITALGGGILRDLLIGVTPPAAFTNLHYLIAAGAGSLLPMFIREPGKYLRRGIIVVDSIGLGLYSAVGTEKALLYQVGPLPAVIVGLISGVAGGVTRDIMVRRVPEVLSSDFYAIPAVIGSATVVGVYALGLDTTGVPTIVGAVVIFLLRLAGLQWKIRAPLAAFHAKPEA